MSKRSIRRLLRVVLGALALVLVVALVGEPLARGLMLRHLIRGALDSATEVRIIEHSNQFEQPDGFEKGHYQEKVYSSVALTAGQVAELRKAWLVSLDFSGTVVKFCAFQDHHRIEAKQSDGSLFVVDICFHCGEIRVAGGPVRMLPLGWAGSLKRFIASLGMTPDGPWENRGAQ